MTTLAILGGTGYAGSHIARAALSRGHEVVAYARSLPAEPIDGVTYRQGSVADAATVTEAAAADVLVVATHAVLEGTTLPDLLPGLVEAARGNGARLAFVGGAGSSLVAPGGPRLIDTPEFHDEWKAEAGTHARVLEALLETPADLDWFYVSPAAVFGAWAPGEATGAYRTGGDVLVTKEDGSSEISGADLALAFVDEIDQPKHSRARFTVGH